MKYKTLLISGTQYGVLLGLSFCMYTILMWLTKLDTTFLNIGQYFDVAIILLPIILILLVIRKLKNNGTINTFLHRVLLVLTIGLVSTLIYQPFLYYYHNFINPEWFDAVINLEFESLKRQGKSSEEIDHAVKVLVVQNEARSGMFSGFIPSAIIIPFICAILSLAFIRNKKMEDFKTV